MFVVQNLLLVTLGTLFCSKSCCRVARENFPIFSNTNDTKITLFALFIAKKLINVKVSLEAIRWRIEEASKPRLLNVATVLNVNFEFSNFMRNKSCCLCVKTYLHHFRNFPAAGIGRDFHRDRTQRKRRYPFCETKANQLPVIVI